MSQTISRQEQLEIPALLALLPSVPADKDAANLLRCAVEDVERTWDAYNVACKRLGKANKLKNTDGAYGRREMQRQAMRELNKARAAWRKAEKALAALR